MRQSFGSCVGPPTSSAHPQTATRPRLRVPFTRLQPERRQGRRLRAEKVVQTTAVGGGKGPNMTKRSIHVPGDLGRCHVFLVPEGALTCLGGLYIYMGGR